MKLFFRKYGAGPDLIILHGLFGLSDNWVSIAKKLAEVFTVYVPDLRNHGFSPWDDCFNYDSMCSDLEEFIEAHDIVKPVLLGHSMGGKVVMNFVSKNPTIPTALVIMDISPAFYSPQKMHLNIIEAMAEISPRQHTTRNEILEKVRIHIADERVIQFVMKNLHRTSHGRFEWKPNIKVISEQLENVFEEVAFTKKISVPTLFLRGEKSDYIDEKDLLFIRDWFSHVNIKSIPEASHWIHADAPEIVISEISAFLMSATKSTDSL